MEHRPSGCGLNAMRIRDVVILTQYFAPESGAASVRLMALARQLQKLGVRVRVITGMPNYPLGVVHPEYKGRLTAREEMNGVPVRRVWLYAASGRGTVKRLLNYLSFTLIAGLALATEKRPDLIFVEAQPLTLALPAWALRVLRGVPYVYNTPDLQVEHAADDGWVTIRWFIRAAAALESKLMRDAACVTTVTHAFIDHFHQKYRVPKERLTFLPNGADTDTLRPLPADDGFAQRLGVAGKRVFTYAGTMAGYQGLEVLVDVAERLRHRSDVAILMVGTGPMKDQLVRTAEARGLSNILFRTSPFGEMSQLMSITTASLVVLRPLEISRKMRLSKAIPPMACAVPVIYAGWGETAELIAREQVGLTVEPGNPDEIALAITKLADDATLAKELGRRGRLLAEREFSWTFLVSDWVRQMELALNGQDPDVPAPRSTRAVPDRICAP